MEYFTRLTLMRKQLRGSWKGDKQSKFLFHGFKGSVILHGSCGEWRLKWGESITGDGKKIRIAQLQMNKRQKYPVMAGWRKGDDKWKLTPSLFAMNIKLKTLTVFAQKAKRISIVSLYYSDKTRICLHLHKLFFR